MAQILSRFAQIEQPFPQMVQILADVRRLVFVLNYPLLCLCIPSYAIILSCNFKKLLALAFQFFS